MAAISKAAFFNNPFIGLYARASDELAILPKNAHEKLVMQAQETLGVPVERLFVNNSHIIGNAIVMNKTGAVVAQDAEAPEVAVLKKRGLHVHKLVRFSPGNVLLATDKAAVLTTRVPKEECKAIGDCLGVEVLQPRMGGLSTIATTVVTNKGILAYNEMTDTELKLLEKIFGVRGMIGTCNLGVQYNGLGIVANSTGALVGMQTTGFETQRIYEALFGDEDIKRRSHG